MPDIPLTKYGTEDTPSKTRAELAPSLVASNNRQSLRHFGKSFYIFIASMLGSLALFWAPLQKLLDFAAGSEFSYITVIPAISAFLIVIRRRAIFQKTKLDPAVGFAILLCATALFALTKVVPSLAAPDRQWLPALGMVTTWLGLFVFSFGFQSARAAMLPLALLLFMIPAPIGPTNAVISFLQHGSAVLSYSLFRMIGVPASRVNTVISLPRLTIEVAPECSGIRSSISLLILTLAACNLYLRSGWNKLLLVCLIVPLSILRNAIRIVTLSTLALYVDRGFLTGPLHHHGGVLFFFLAVTILIPIVVVMQRFEKRIETK